MKRILVGIAVVASSASSGAAQVREITGTVKQAHTGRPVANAEVMVIGEAAGVCTNDRGEYRLQVPAGSINLIARTNDFLSRPRTVEGTDWTAP